MSAARRQRLLPPHVVLAVLVIQVTLARTVAIIDLLDVPATLLGIPILTGGLLLNISCARRFERLETNIITFKDPDLLVTSGWFARTRNPMYVGFVLVLSGVATLTGAFSAWVGPIAFFILANWRYIPFEERRLQSQFGRDYEAYRRVVRRWI